MDGDSGIHADAAEEGVTSARVADGADVVIRRVRPSDQRPLADFYAGLSPESRRARFLGIIPGLTPSQSLSFCTPDHQHGEGFVAVAGDRLVGHLCLEPNGAGSLELAVAVADEWQGRTIGRRLFEAALAWARGHGCRTIVATAYADNLRVLRLLSSAPLPPTVRGPEAGVVTVTIPLSGALPQPWRKVVRPQRPQRLVSATSPCRVVWRRRRPPVRDAAG